MELSPEEHLTQRQRRVGKGIQGGQVACAKAQGWDRAGSVNLKKLHVGSYAGLKTTVVRRARWPHLVPERSLYSESKGGSLGGLGQGARSASRFRRTTLPAGSS